MRIKFYSEDLRLIGHLKEIDVNGKKKFEILKEPIARMGAGFNWLGIGYNGRLLSTQ